jgi:hypothetical protein
VVGPANCFATRYGRSRIQSKAKQLGLRFVAAKLPGLRIGRVVGKLVELVWGLGTQRSPIVDSGVSCRQPAVSLYNKQSSAAEL